MVKIILALAIALTGMFAFQPEASASGKISVQNNWQNGGKDYRPAFGLSVYEPVFSKLAYLNLWGGYGQQAFEDVVLDDAQWAVMKAQLDLRMINRLNIAPGAQYRFVTAGPIEKEDVTFYVRLDYQLW